MGCVSSNEIKTSDKCIEVRLSKTSSSYDLSIFPIAQSTELTIQPINTTFSSSNSDEELLINSFITSCVAWRNSHKGNCNLDKQLKLKRLEMICIGAFIQSNKNFKKYKILGIDMSINQIFNKKFDFSFRPDLLLLHKETNQIIHVEIDEYGHKKYEHENEIERKNKLKSAITELFPNYKLIRFNPNIYENRVEMANAFAQFLNVCDGIITVE